MSDENEIVDCCASCEYYILSFESDSYMHAAELITDCHMGDLGDFSAVAVKSIEPYKKCKNYKRGDCLL